MTSDPRGPGARLRIGITLPGNVPVWQARCIEQLRAVPGVDIGLVLRDHARGADSAAIPQTWMTQLLRFIFPRSCDRLVSAAAGTYGRTLPIEKAFDAPVALPLAENDGSGDDQAVRQAVSNLDVLLHLGSSDPPPWLRSLPRYGTWIFHDGDPDRSAQVPAGFWDWFERVPATGRALVALGKSPGVRAILRCGWHLCPTSSWEVALERVRGIGLEWPATACRTLLQNPRADIAERMIAEPDRRTRRPLTTSVLARVCLRGARTSLGRRLTGVASGSGWRQPSWGVAVVDAPIAAFLQGWPRSKVRWIDRPSRFAFHADPFVATWKGRRAVLTEYVEMPSGRGVIAARDIRPDGTWSQARPVLRLPIHLSYPYLFEDGGQLYCIPEAFQAGGVLLFRAAEFPDRWELAGRLLDGFPAADPTLLHHDGFYWLFCTDARNGPTRDLHLWFAPELLGPWTPHPRNPVKIDVRSARPAGTPFVHEGRLFRPAQDCSRTYGGALVFNLVRHLAPDRFEEETHSVLMPRAFDRFPHGLHHVCADGDRTLIDGKRWVINVPAGKDAVPPPDASESLEHALARYTAAGPQP